MNQTLITRINGMRIIITFNGNEYVGKFDGNIESLPYELRSTYYCSQLAPILLACMHDAD